MTKKYLLPVFMIFILTGIAAGQEAINANGKAGTDTIAEPRRSDALNIFLDCERCDRNYIREMVTYVNYVNNRDEADVFVMLTNRSTGGGGTETIVSFTGLRNYKGVNDTVTYFNPPNTSSDLSRQGQANTIAMGLMRYVARTPLRQNIRINFEDAGGKSKKLSQVVENDPWDSWVFRMSSRGSFSKDQTYANVSSENSFSADRVTPDWKSEFDSQYEFRQQSITRNGVTKHYPRKNWSLRTLQVKSISDHFSAGANISASGSTFGNIKYALNFHPALEYNIYPYSESYKRQIRIQYTMQVNYNNYMDTTLYYKLEEVIYRHQLAVSVGLNQPWGSGDFSIRGGHFLNDASFWNFNMFGSISWRVYKGLSVSFNARASIIRDDRAILKEEASDEEILLELRKLNSAYSYNVGFGLSYSFGSIYNNVVNPRFSSR